MQDLRATAPALTSLSEEETMFRDAVREFAETEVRPHVQEMDEAAQFRPDLIPRFFELGLMGIEMPEAYGGAGGTIFMAVLAIEELARVDASAAIYVDVHNTLVNNAAVSAGATSEQQSALLPPADQRPARARSRSPSPAAAAMPSPWRPGPSSKGDDWELTGTEVLDHQRRRGRALHRLRQRRLRPRATRESPASWWSATSPASRSARRRTSSASGPRARPS